jgi:hypothetical protein
MSSKILSIDSGSSYMKAYCGPDEKIQFPAIVRDLEGNPLSNRAMQIRVADNYYLVGHTAATSINMAIKTPHIEEDFHGSRIQLVQMCYAMERLKKVGAMDRLICSLPYSDSLNRDLQRKLLERKTFEWSVRDGDGQEFERVVEFDHVNIVAQGVGAMQLHVQQSRAKKEPKCRAVMLVDVGSCTTDVVTIQENEETQEYEFCDQACTTIENANVNWFASAWIQNLKTATRNLGEMQKYDYYSLMRHAIENDFQMQIGDRVIDAKIAFDQARSDFTDLLKPQVVKAAGDKWLEVNKIIFTGGGSYLINFDVFHDARIIKLNHWANAEGQFGMFNKPAVVTRPQPQTIEARPEMQASV